MNEEQKRVALIDLNGEFLGYAVGGKLINKKDDVVKQLVEALKELMSIVTIHSRTTSNNFAWAEMDEAKTALAAAKEVGLW